MDGSHRSLVGSPFARQLLALTTLVLVASAHAATYTVGSGQTYTKLSSLPPLNPGDLVQVNSGTYNEVVRWTRAGTAASPITIRGVGSTRPVIDGTGKTIDGTLPNPRAIFQIEASYITIENFEFKNGRNGENGAGIRITATGGNSTNFTTIRNCKITNCDMGVMSDSNDNLLFESCEIASNGTSAFSGYCHNFYLNGNKTTLRFCYIHDALYGQNFKTRGHYTELLYNTIANSQDGEIGLVDSALTATANSNAVMIGNVIVSKPRLSGWNVARFIQFGQDEGGTHTGTLYAFNNTFVAGDSRINFVNVNTSSASAVMTNNIFTGSNVIATGAGASSGSNNWLTTGATVPSGFTGSVLSSAPGLTNPGARNYHLVSGSACIDHGASAPTCHDGAGASFSGVPAYEYVNDLSSVARTLSGTLDIGAYEFHPAGPIAPSITTQPASVTVNPGQTATFTVAASGTAPFTYQWQKNSANISGATAASYTTPAATSADNGSTFRCVVSNSAGSATSNAATLTVTTAPAITTQPANVTVNAGQTAKFTVAASGSAPLTYQWQKNGTNISGATAASYTTPATTSADSGSTFRCVVSNSAGSATSNAATLTVVTPPSITTQPASVTVTLGQTAKFTVTASGSATLTYQWQKNGANISGATAASYTTPATTSADNGSTFRCIVSNSAGSATSTAATLTIANQPPVITGQPASITVNVGQTAKFTVTASGAATLTYQWQKNGANISGATAASYTTPATTNADNGSTFRCVVSNSAGSVTSSSATLTIANQPPVITSAATATPTAAVTGQSITFTVAASDPNGDTLTYSWNYGDGTSGSGATASHAYAAAGIFTAVATVSDGKGGSVTSSAAVTITAGSTSSSVVAVNSGGKTAGSFTADASFTGGSTYTTTSAITTTGVTSPAPQAVYQSERYGNFSYTVGGLTAGATYTVRLHFAEIWWNAAGQRVFNVSINGTQVLSNFDIYAAAGGKFKAIVQEFSAVATSGQIVIAYQTIKDNAKSSGIEIVSTTTTRALTRDDATTADDSISSIDLGSVKAGASFKLKLDVPDAGKNVRLRFTAPSLKTLPPGVRVSGGYVGGKPKTPGTYTFQLTITGKNAGATNTYTLTVEP